MFYKVDGDIWSINKENIFTSTRGVYQLPQIRIYVSVLQNGWVTLGQLSIRASKRCVSIASNPNMC